MISRYMLLLCSGTVALVAGSAAGAQVSPSETPAAPQSSTSATDSQHVPGTRTGRPGAVNEAEIVVTGQRRVDLPTDVLPVTVLSAETRNLLSAGTAQELVNLTPSFTFTDAFGLSVRGVGRQTPQTLLGQENTVLQYVDGFLNLVPSNIAESTLFGGNVQFDAGPQGTRYGRNALAGSVNLISRAPTDTLRGEADFGVGRGGAFNIGANVSGPLSDELGIRLGAQKFNFPSTRSNIGSAGNAGLASNDAYFELQLQYTHGPFHIRTRTTHYEFVNRPDYTSPAATTANPNGYNTTLAFLPGGLTPNPGYKYNVPSPQQPYTINVDDRGYNKLSNNLQQIVNADYDLGGAALVYVGGYQQYRATGSADYDLTSRASYVAGAGDPFIPGTVVPTRQLANYDNNDDFWSQELRVESRNKGPFKWVIGGYYFNQHFDESYWQNIPDAGAVLTTPTIGGGPALAAPNPRKSFFEQRNIFNVRSVAGFGNATYSFTPNLELDAGVRYTFDHKDAITNFRYIFYYPPLFAGDFSPAVHGATPNQDNRGLSGHAALTYRPTEALSVYASAAHGYQSSAFTLGQGLPPNNIAGSEHLDVYEIGGTFKASSQLKVEASGFYQNFFNMQIPISSVNVTPGPNGPVISPAFTRFVNAHLAKISGAQAEVTWQPVPGANLTANYTHLIPTFAAFNPVNAASPPGVVDINNPGAGLQDLSGSQIPRAPHDKFAAYGYYTFDLGKIGSLIPGGSVVYQSKFYVAPFQTSNYLIGSHTVANFTLTYRTSAKNLDVVASVENAFREIYVDDIPLGINGTNVPGTRVLGADRFYSLTARLRY